MGEAENMEENEKGLTLKPIVLPHITMTLKRAWKANQENMEKARFFLIFVLGSKRNQGCICGESYLVHSNICPGY
jgi:hypothetical protein